jgi:hypothetical protein
MLMRPGAEQENKGYTLRVKKARLPPGLLERNVAPRFLPDPDLPHVAFFRASLGEGDPQHVAPPGLICS